MDIVAAFLIFVALFFVATWTLSATAKRHLMCRSAASVDETLVLCDSKFRGFFWKRVDGPGELNFQYRFNIPVRGQQAPVVSVSVEPAADGRGSDVEVWMSSWTSMYGAANGAERVAFAKWSLSRAIRELNGVTAS